MCYELMNYVTVQILMFLLKHTFLELKFLKLFSGQKKLRKEGQKKATFRCLVYVEVYVQALELRKNLREDRQHKNFAITLRDQTRSVKFEL